RRSPPEPGTPAGYAFLTMRSEEDAARLVASGLPPLLGRTRVVARRQPRSGGRLMDYFLLLLDGQAQARSFSQGQGGTLPVVYVLLRQQLPVPLSTTSVTLPEL